MKEFLEIRFEGWTATPRLPFILAGNALCMQVPSYSTVLGIIGCCLGRLVHQKEVFIGYKYKYDTEAEDLETRHRLEFDGRNVKSHAKGTDAYKRAFHTNPQLTIWIDKLEWEEYFQTPVGSPSLGQSQDLLVIKSVRKVKATKVDQGVISGCMIPFKGTMETSGQLVQIAESFEENEAIGSGRKSFRSRIFLAIPYDADREIRFENIYKVDNTSIYIHDWL